MNDNENIFDGCFEQMDNGLDQSGILFYLHEQHMTLIEALLISMKLYGLRPDEARRILSSHPAWQTEVDGLVPTPGSFAAWLRQKNDPQNDATAAQQGGATDGLPLRSKPPLT